MPNASVNWLCKGRDIYKKVEPLGFLKVQYFNYTVITSGLMKLDNSNAKREQNSSVTFNDITAIVLLMLNILRLPGFRSA